jgi:hypothetical protein
MQHLAMEALVAQLQDLVIQVTNMQRPSTETSTNRTCDHGDSLASINDIGMVVQRLCYQMLWNKSELLRVESKQVLDNLERLVALLAESLSKKMEESDICKGCQARNKVSHDVVRSIRGVLLESEELSIARSGWLNPLPSRYSDTDIFAEDISSSKRKIVNIPPTSKRRRIGDAHFEHLSMDYYLSPRDGVTVTSKWDMARGMSMPSSNPIRRGDKNLVAATIKAIEQSSVTNKDASDPKVPYQTFERIWFTQEARIGLFVVQKEKRSNIGSTGASYGPDEVSSAQ